MTDETTAIEVAPQEQVTQQPAAELTPHQQFREMLPEELRADPSFNPYTGESVNEIVGKLAKSYVNVNKLVGADKNAVLKIPSSAEDKDGWNAVYSKLGRPEKVEGYEIDKYKEVPGVDEKSLGEIAQVAYENGVSKNALNAIIGKYLEQAGGAKTVGEQELEQTIEGYAKTLKTEWGEAYDTKTAKVLETLKQKADPEFLNLAGDYPFIFDHPAVMRTMDALIQMRAEDPGVKSGGSSPSGPMTPNEARAGIAAMEGDQEKMKILMTQGHPMRDTLLAEREKLFKYAYPS